MIVSKHKNAFIHLSSMLKHVTDHRSMEWQGCVSLHGATEHVGALLVLSLMSVLDSGKALSMAYLPSFAWPAVGKGSNQGPSAQAISQAVWHLN